MQRIVLGFLMILVVIISVFIFFLAVPASAQSMRDAALGNLNKAVGKFGLESDLATSAGTVIKTALSLVGTIFLILTVYAGILWMTARGNEEHVKKAKEIITASIIGLVIVLSAYAVTYFVTTKLGGNAPGSGTQNTPVGPSGSP